MSDPIMSSFIPPAFDLLTTLQQFVNVKAVILSVAATQGIKMWILPSPAGGAKADTVPGTWTTRFLPFVPLMIGLFATFILEHDSKYTMEDGVRGIMSGILAAYSYKTAKVTFFGE